jgi:hypothetical protein
MRDIVKYSAVVIIAAAGLIVYQVGLPLPTDSIFGFGGNSEDQRSFQLWRTLLLYFVTLCGIWGRILQMRLSAAGKGPISMRYELIGSFSEPNLWIAVLVSPIIFVATYKAAAQNPDTVLALVLAFQNGFFWQTILKRQS